jgi:hypothetical protein
MKLEDLKPRPFEEREEGIFEMEDQLYRAAPGLSQSMLKVLMPPGSCDSARSAAHFQTQLKQPPEPPTPARIMGTLIDHALLEPKRYLNSFHVRPKGMLFTSTEGKAWKLAHGDRPIIDENDVADIRGMIESVSNHRIASVMMEQCHRQASIFCAHGPTGIVRKGRSDLLLASTQGQPVIADLKTAENGSPFQFARDAAKWGYHIQQGYYQSILEGIIGERPLFLFIVVEKSAPYACTVYQFDKESVDAGLKLCEEALLYYAQCVNNNHWPAYSESIETLRLPNWAINPRPAIVPDWL